MHMKEILILISLIFPTVSQASDSDDPDALFVPPTPGVLTGAALSRLATDMVEGRDLQFMRMLINSFSAAGDDDMPDSEALEEARLEDFRETDVCKKLMSLGIPEHLFEGEVMQRAALRQQSHLMDCDEKDDAIKTMAMGMKKGMRREFLETFEKIRSDEVARQVAMCRAQKKAEKEAAEKAREEEAAALAAAAPARKGAARSAAEVFRVSAEITEAVRRMAVLTYGDAVTVGELPLSSSLRTKIKSMGDSRVSKHAVRLKHAKDRAAGASGFAVRDEGVVEERITESEKWAALLLKVFQESGFSRAEAEEKAIAYILHQKNMGPDPELDFDVYTKILSHMLSIKQKADAGEVAFYGRHVEGVTNTVDETNVQVMSLEDFKHLYPDLLGDGADSKRSK